MKKERNNKFKKALSKMKKPLMIFSIILNIIFALALVIGLSSKPKAQSVRADDIEVVVDDLSNTNWEITLDTISNWDTPVISNTSFDVDGQISNSSLSNWAFDTIFINNSGFLMSKNIYFSDSNTEVYVLEGGNLTDSVNFPLNITFITGTDITNSQLISWINSNANYVDEPTPDEPTEADNDIIYLGDNFNPVSYVTQNGDYILNGFAGKHANQSTGYLTLTGLTFKSNNTTFNTIKIAYGNLPAIAPIVTQDGSTYLQLGGEYNDYLCCFGVFYQYIEQDNSVSKSVQVISYRRTIIDDNGVGIKAYDVRSPYIIWLNNEYRTLEVLEDEETIQSSSYLTINGMTTMQLLQVTSSVNTNVMGLTDVFGLLKGAFAGITGILAISILPGITLGLLLFIPLIVTIIIAVVRLIKK